MGSLTMGLKLRLGLALSGLALSSMFGVNMLAGVKDYVDTTGNIMVDIADGIGMVSKGIEALEYWLDPEAASRSSPSSPDNPSSDPATPASESAPPTPSPAADQPKVFCRKGKCYPYDPDKINPNVNLEMKPGMILTASEPNSNQRKHKQKQKNRNSEQEQNIDVGGK